MKIKKRNLHLTVDALRRCVNENSGREYPTGNIRVSDICADVADYLEKLDKPMFSVRFEGCAGNLSIEKQLHTYIRDNYSDTVVSEPAIERIVEDLKSFQDAYFENHRGIKIEIRVNDNYCTGGKFLVVGQMCITLVPVKKEII